MKLYTSSVGVNVELDTELPSSVLDGASLLEIKVRTPAGALTTWDASRVSGTSRIRHTITTGDALTKGTYKLQAHITFGTASVFGDTANLQVYSDFE